MEYIHPEVFDAARDMYDFILWLDRECFINIRYRTCDECQELMHLEADASCIDKFCMSCGNTKCNARQSIRRRSFFEHGDLPIQSVLHILIGFVGQTPATCLSQSFALEYSAVMAYYQKARELWSADIRRKPIQFEANTEYEAAETLIRDVEIGNGQERRTIWVGGILERDTRKCKLYMLRSRTTDEIIPPIVEYVPAGSLIYTSELNCYSRLDVSYAAYQHYCVNHSRREYSRVEDLGDGERVKVHTNGIKGLFSRLRTKLRCADRRCEHTVQLYLDEMMYRGSGRSLFELFKTYLDL